MIGSLVVGISRDLKIVEPGILTGVSVGADSFVSISIESNKIDTRKCYIKISDSIYDEGAEIADMRDLMREDEYGGYGWRKLLHVF
jgi:hypothetical protein